MQFVDFRSAINDAKKKLLTQGELVDTGRWQGVPTKGKPDLMTQEILNWSAVVPIPSNISGLQMAINPNLPWAEDHFQERVSGNPTNPDVSYEYWPWWKGQAQASMVADGQVFTHTYSERFWPKHAWEMSSKGETHITPKGVLCGIRYEYGDLNDVINLLARDPFTRQAYLPIFFPEDTGAVHGGRIPCTLGYHFMRRGWTLHIWYEIRSCDYVRHLRDDLYLASRLCQHVLRELQEIRNIHRLEPELWDKVMVGNLYFLTHSLHYHQGDAHHITPSR